MSIDELKQQRIPICMALHMKVQPLRDRLAGFGFLIWWGGIEYRLSTDWIDETGTPFRLSDERYEALMSMSDDELRMYCTKQKVALT